MEFKFCYLQNVKLLSIRKIKIKKAKIFDTYLYLYEKKGNPDVLLLFLYAFNLYRLSRNEKWYAINNDNYIL